MSTTPSAVLTKTDTQAHSHTSSSCSSQFTEIRKEKFRSSAAEKNNAAARLLHGSSVDVWRTSLWTQLLQDEENAPGVRHTLYLCVFDWLVCWFIQRWPFSDEQ